MANTKVTGDLIASGTITAANLVTGTLDSILGTYLSTNSYATQSYVTTAVSNLIDAAPASLDTLNELAAALNDDANFATTVTNALATKLNLSGGNITGNLSVDTNVLFVDTVNDRVGIGVTSPNWKLDLNTTSALAGFFGSSNADATVLGINNSSTGDPQLKFYLNGIGKYTLGVDNADGDKFKIGTTDIDINPRLVIDSSGNVGLRTSSPDTDLHLDGNNVDDVQFRIKNNNIANGGKYLGILVGGTTGFGINGWANSGIIESAAGINSNLVLGNYQAGPIIFQTNNRVEKMRITSGGDVLPGADDSYSLGDGTNRWRYLYNKRGVIYDDNGNYSGGLIQIVVRADNAVAATGNQTQVATGLGISNRIHITGGLTLTSSTSGQGTAINIFGTTPASGTNNLGEFAGIRVFSSTANSGSLFLLRVSGSGAIDASLTITIHL